MADLPLQTRLPLRSGDIALDLFQPDAVSERYLGWLADADVMRYTEARFHMHDAENARAYVAQSNSGDRARLWRILTDDLGHVGNVRLSDVNWSHGRAAVAILIGEKGAWGRGVGSRAVGLVSWYAFHAAGLRKLTAGMYADNIGSIRAFEKAGFQTEGRLVDHYLSEDGLQDAVLMRCFAEDLRLGPDEGRP